MESYKSADFETIGAHGHWIVWVKDDIVIKQLKNQNNKGLLYKNVQTFSLIKDVVKTTSFLEICLFDGTPALMTERLINFVSPNSVDPDLHKTMLLCQIEGGEPPMECKLEQQYFKSKIGPILNEEEFLQQAKQDMLLLAEKRVQPYGDSYFFKVSETDYDIDYIIADWDNIDMESHLSIDEIYGINEQCFHDEYDRFKYYFARV